MAKKETNQSSPDKASEEAPGPPMDMRVAGALVRTALSAEQSLMSWERTSVSLFTFGFSITQFFHYLEQRQAGTQLAEGPRRLGLALICVGILALVLGMIEHVQRMQSLKDQGMPAVSRSLLPIASAALLLVVGIAGFIAVVLNWSF